MITRILKFLMIAAVAWPAWTTATAQEVKQASKSELAVIVERPKTGLDAINQDEATPFEMKVKQSESKQSQQQAKAAKAAVNSRKVDYFGKGSKGSNSDSPKLKASSLRAATLPSGVTAEEWKISTNFYNVGASGFIDFRSTVKVAIDGNDIYIQGLDYWFADAWVQGTINGNTAVFETGQLFGSDDQGDDYFVGFDTEEGAVSNVTFTYSAAAHKLTLPENMMLLIGADTEGGYWAYHINTVIAKEYVEPPVPVEIGADAVDPSAYIPIYGYYYEQSTTSQMLYPASMLSNFVPGQKIKSVTFYTYDESGIQFSGGQITVTMGTTSNTYFTGNSALPISGTTATVVPTKNSTTLKVEFDTPLEYTEGANLIIQMVNTTTGDYAKTNWLGVAYTGNTQYYSYSSRGDGYSSARRLQFLPKTTFELQNPPTSLTDELDFEVVEVDQSKTLPALVENPNSVAVSATVTTAAPFSASSPVTLQPGVNRIPVTFTPTDPNVYNGNLTVDINGSTITIPLKGIGFVEGPQALRDSTFFAGVNYNWTDSTGTKHSSNLNEIATDPDQMIAMIREVYMNRTIPGNYKRGYTTSGGDEAWNTVNYAGVGTITASISGSNISYSYEDGYGWKIPGNLKTGSSTSYLTSRYGTSYYSYMDSTQYKPYNEGVTLLLVEMVDDFNDSTAFNTNETEPYNQLRNYIKNSIKSIRVVTEAKRTGTGFNSGTLFKIDCDKMNKFYLMAKGQLRWIYNSIFAKDSDGDNLGGLFCANPCYIYNPSSYNSVNGFFDNKSYPLFYNMFEEFSPVVNTSATAMKDIYQDLVNMNSFGVVHDCMGVPYMGHQFMMYGEDSPSNDCQDVRDLMFFVPDYRMMKWDGRESHGQQKFMNYNQSYQPTMGLFVIKQFPIEGEQETYQNNPNYYKLDLSWTSNLLNFLPGKEGVYKLYRVVTNADGTKTYQLVAGNLGSNTFSYVDYVEMQQTGQQVTYVVRGQDKDGFLTLQMSNEESFIIPGLDRAEQIRIALNSDYYFSRYDAADQTNNYSNSIIANNTVGTNVKPNYLVNGSQFKFWRATLDENGDVVAPTEPFVVAEVSNYSQSTGGTLTYKYWKNQTDFSGKPYGHGYHSNVATSTISIQNGEVKFDGLKLYDNFSVSVEENTHPSQYVYYVTLETAVSFPLNDAGTETSNQARSNTVSVPVYKTGMKMNPIDKETVDADTKHLTPAATTFDLKARYSSKSEILGYYIYRWADKETAATARSIYESNGEDSSPQGQAGNQLDNYTVAMNTDYTAETANFTADAQGNYPDVTASFVDNFMINEAEEGDTYTYAPVVELFAPVQAVNLPSGTDRVDYNTYGGPQQMSAGGIIEVKVIDKKAWTKGDAGGPMETWTNNGETYTYYRVILGIDNLELPGSQGEYKLYKIRAWNKVDGSDVDMELIENYVDGEQLFVDSAECKSGELACIFPGRVLSGDDNIPMDFTVRIYFTKNDTSATPSGAPRLKEEGEAPRYYIAETTANDKITSDIPTGISTIYGKMEPVSVKYYNAAGVESDHPFKGVNIVVKQYENGNREVVKVIK